MTKKAEKIPAKIPYIGVGAIITRHGKFFLMKRKLSHGHGSWSSPGGYLAFGESPAEGAAREAAEEVGFAGGEFSFLAITNDVFGGKHFLTVWLAATAPDDWEAAQVSDEVAETGWFLPAEFPAPIFEPFANLMAGRSLPGAAFGDLCEKQGRS